MRLQNLSFGWFVLTRQPSMAVQGFKQTPCGCVCEHCCHVFTAVLWIAIQRQLYHCKASRMDEMFYSWFIGWVDRILNTKEPLKDEKGSELRPSFVPHLTAVALLRNDRTNRYLGETFPVLKHLLQTIHHEVGVPWNWHTLMECCFNWCLVQWITPVKSESASWEASTSWLDFANVITGSVNYIWSVH